MLAKQIREAAKKAERIMISTVIGPNEWLYLKGDHTDLDAALELFPETRDLPAHTSVSGDILYFGG